MANRKDKAAANVAGKFYNDNTCIDCMMCPEMAPMVFRRHDDGYSYVHKQPSTAEEIAMAREAMERCPTESIGDDGDLP